VNLNDPFTRAVVETVVVAVVTFILLFVVASLLQSAIGLFVAVCVAAVGFGLVWVRAKKLMEDYV
jgi:hypothetical protein